jgi:hypothetical protein
MFDQDSLLGSSKVCAEWKYKIKEIQLIIPNC